MRITDEQILIVETTFKNLGGKGHQFIEGFYQKLFKEAPEIEAMFSRANWQQQRSKFMTVLIMIVDSLHDKEHIEAMLKGAIHAHMHHPISDEHYDLMVEAILSTLSKILENQWTEDVEIAWRTALEDIMFILKKHSKG